MLEITSSESIFYKETELGNECIILKEIFIFFNKGETQIQDEQRYVVKYLEQ